MKKFSFTKPVVLISIPILGIWVGKFLKEIFTPSTLVSTRDRKDPNSDIRWDSQEEKKVEGVN